MKNAYLMSVIVGLFGFIGQSSAQQYMDVNQVRTFVLPNNSLFWDLQQFANYEVPKGSGKHSLYMGNLWFIGKDANGNFHGFADRYRAEGPDTYTGPLKIDGSATTDFSTVFNFGRVWKVTRADITALQMAQGNGTLANGTFTPAIDVVEWPGNGPVGYTQDLAPYFDANADNIYNISDGDYPIIKGEEMLYWVLNDTYGQHNETWAAQMGVEIHVSFYACKNLEATGSDDIINYTTFLEYEVINRSTNNYTDIYAAFNSDFDLGYAFDDYIGCHVDADAFYIYNGDAFDAQGTFPAPDQYGVDWPVQSVQILEGKEVNGRTMSSFLSYNNGSGPNGDPGIGNVQHFYDLMTGYGSGVFYGNTTLQTPYMYPGISDPQHVGTGGVDPGFAWWQYLPCDTCQMAAPSDQRGVGATGPFELPSGGSVKVVLGLITTFDSTLTMTARVEKNREQNKILKQWYENNSLPCVYGTLSDEENVSIANLSLYPNPASSLVRIEGGGVKSITKYTVTDMHGKNLLSGKAKADGIIEFNVENLAQGIYYVRITEGAGQNRTMKFIKQ